MKTHLLYCLLLALACASCTKDPTTGTTTVEGQVVEDQSRQPVPGATVQLYHKQNGGYQAVGNRIPTNAQGRYAFSFEATSTTGYFLTAIAAPGYFTPEQNAPYLTAGRANTGVTIALLAPAWVRLQLVDEPPKNRVSMFISGYEGNGDRLYYPRDTVLVRPLIAGFSGRINWVVTNEQGNDNQYFQTIQVGALDTAKVRIAF
jgi:5-hydroxyisourate hydrolase-like protein (transthyretin family)